MPQLVLTAVGPDRPGLVGQFTGHLFNSGANIADSRMVNLRGQFALIVLVEGDIPSLSKLRTSLAAESSTMGLTVTFAAEGPEARPAPTGPPFRLKTYSMDQPGIVHRVSALLHQHGINIEDLETTLAPAPFTGGALFTLELRMSVPPSVQVKTLRRELEALCDQLNCDFDLEPA